MVNHIIHKQKVLLKTRRNHDFFHFQARVGSLFQNELAVGLNALFDEFVSSEQIIRIENLQLHLGHLQSENFEQNFKKSFFNEIKKELSKIKSKAGFQDEASTISVHQSLREGFIYFLKYGTLPWYNSIKKIVDWETLMLSTFTVDDWALSIKFLQEERIVRPIVIERLVEQFSNEFLEKIFILIAPEFKDNWKEIFEDLVAFCISLKPVGNFQICAAIWVTCFTSISNSKKGEGMLSIIVTKLFNQVGVGTGDHGEFEINSWEHIAETRVVRAAIKQFVEDLLSSKGKEVSTEKFERGENSKTPIDDQINDTALQKWVENTDGNNITNKSDYGESDENNTSGSIEKNGKGELSEKVEDENKSLDEAEMNESEERDNNVVQIEKRKKRLNEIDKDAIAETQYVSNSGIVILHPFLEAYFTELDLLQGRQFINLHASARAVLLLHYLATGEEEVAEFELVLEKVLCGYPPNETLSNKLELSEKEKEELLKLLESVIGYWPPLNNTSISGLRDTFIQRQGRLSPKENGWHLTVEQKTVDILLGKLPWGFSTIRQPWMEAVLNVDWY